MTPKEAMSLIGQRRMLGNEVATCASITGELLVDAKGYEYNVAKVWCDTRQERVPLSLHEFLELKAFKDEPREEDFNQRVAEFQRSRKRRR